MAKYKKHGFISKKKIVAYQKVANSQLKRRVKENVLKDHNYHRHSANGKITYMCNSDVDIHTPASCAYIVYRHSHMILM